MPHLEEGILHALVDGEIDSSELAPLDQHLQQCEHCRQRLEEARILSTGALDLVELLDPPPVSPPADVGAPRARKQRWRTLAWAASVVLAAGIGYTVRDQILAPTSSGEQATVRARAEGSYEDNRTSVLDTLVSQAPESQPTAPAPSPPRLLEGVRDKITTSPPQDRLEASGRQAKEEEQPLERRAASPPAPARQARRDTAATPDDGLVAKNLPNVTLRDEGFRGAQEFDARRLNRAVEPETQSNDISLDDAATWSGGQLRVIGGLIPASINRLADTVRLTYRWEGRRIRLIQVRRGDTLDLRFEVPEDFPAESLAILRTRLTRP